MHKNNTSTPEVRPATITAEAMVRAEEFARALVEDDDGVGLFDAQDLAALLAIIDTLRERVTGLKR